MLATQPVDIPSGRTALGAPSSSNHNSPEHQPGSLSERLTLLKLQCNDDDAVVIDRVLSVLADVVSGPSIVTSFGTGQEALWWDCFAEVYEREVAEQTRALGEEPSSSGKRQILADILVWAEITQDHYDSSTLKFVTEPHLQDESFQRIGKLLEEVKAAKGLPRRTQAQG